MLWRIQLKYVILFLVCAGLACILSAEPVAGTPDATGNVSCKNCHRYQVMMFQYGPHASLDAEKLYTLVGAASGCEVCHGNTSMPFDYPNHLSEIAREKGCEAVYAFNQKDTPGSKVQRCMWCHRNDQPRFRTSPHAMGGMDCTSCHDIVCGQSTGLWPLQKTITQYGSLLQPDTSSSTCLECHSDVVAQFEMSEGHRLEEGIVECVSCHNPHEPQQNWGMSGFGSKVCDSCHVDKTGPFVFEHGATRVEGCAACHTPHGSPNRHMLNFQNVAEQCYGCHVIVPTWHSRFTLESSCTACHSTIHGSNLSPFFLK